MESNGMSEELEMAIINKEIAEEKVEMLKGEIEDLKYEIQLIQEKVGEDFEKERMQLKTVIEGLVQSQKVYEEKLKETEKVCFDYKERADAALEAEKMITLLTIKNQEMEDKIKKLEKENIELEDLIDVDNQIVETQKERERILAIDCENLKVKCKELQNELERSDKEKQSLTNAILKFREHAEVLKREIEAKENQIKQIKQNETTSLKEDVSIEEVEKDDSFMEVEPVEVSVTKEEIKKEEIKENVHLISEEQLEYYKDAVRENETLHWELKKKNAEVQELKKLDIKKTHEFEVQKFRLESKMKSETRDKIKQLEEQIEKTTSEIIRLEREKKELEFNLRDKDTEIEEVKSLTSYKELDEKNVNFTREIELLNLRLEVCEAELSTYKQENMRLLCNKSIKSVKIPDIISGPVSFNTIKRDDRLDSLESEAILLRKELIKYSVYIPDLSKPLHNQKEGYQQFIANKNAINLRMFMLQKELQTIQDSW